MYFHTWELDPDQPRDQGCRLSQQARQYRNLEHMPSDHAALSGSLRFTSIAQISGSTSRVLGEARTVRGGRSSPSAKAAPGWQQPLTGRPIVVPCYNEEQALPYLANTLRSVVASGRPVPLRALSLSTTAVPISRGVTLHTIFGAEPTATWFVMTAIGASPRPSRPDSTRRRPRSSARWTATAPTTPMISAG